MTAACHGENQLAGDEEGGELMVFEVLSRLCGLIRTELLELRCFRAKRRVKGGRALGRQDLQTADELMQKLAHVFLTRRVGHRPQGLLGRQKLRVAANPWHAAA